MNGVQLVGWLTDNACHAARGRDVPQSPGVSRPLGGDRLVDDLAQPDPRLPGGGGVFAPDLLPQPVRFGYLLQRLRQYRLLDVPALQHVLGAALELLQRGSERLLMHLEQGLRHGLLSRHDHAEPQRQHRHLDCGRVQDLRVRLQILWCPKPSGQVHHTDEGP